MPSPDDKGEFSHISDLIEHHLSTQKNEWDRIAGKDSKVDALLKEQRQRLEWEIQKKEAALEEAKHRKREQDMNDAAQKKIEEIVNAQVKKDKYAKGRLSRSITNTPVLYRVPAGTTILIYIGNGSIISNPTVLGSDFEAIVSSKDVAYEPDDVLVNPILGTFKRNSGLDGLLKWLYNTEGMYFAFELPENDKNIPCILVSRDDVVIIWKESEVLKSALRKLLDQDVRLMVQDIRNLL